MTIITLRARIDSISMTREWEGHVFHASKPAAIKSILDSLDLATVLGKHALPFLSQCAAETTDRGDVGTTECCNYSDVDQQAKDSQSRG